MASLSDWPHASLTLLAGPSALVVITAGMLALAPAKTGTVSESLAVSAPQTVVIEPRAYSYRAPGEYSRDGYAVDAPLRTIEVTRPLTIMKYQVSRGDYARCVQAGVCPSPEPEFTAAVEDADMPATGISFDDANIYAKWLSDRTGDAWRLPTDAQLAFAAGARFPDDAISTVSSNPAERWLEKYRREIASSAGRDPVPKPRGHFGENEFGLADFGGNVWEWTTTCYRRVAENEVARTEALPCGVQFVAGRHRAAMVSFIRNPKGGACAVGAPPENLGFRLVKDTRWYTSLLRLMR